MTDATFQGQTIVVTGAAGGIGSAIGRAFVTAGGRVVLADIDERAGSALAEALGDAACFMALDVTDESAWVSMLDTVDAKLGGLNVLVNNAGFFQPNVPFEDMPLELWRKHFAINADSVFLGCKHGIARMKTRGGAIVNIGSGMSIVASPTASAYCGSKAAVLMTTRTAAASAGGYNIRVNAVLPGPVHTPMLLGNMTPEDNERDFLDQLASHGALGRLATVDDVARAVLFFADPANGAVTGAYLAVDSGNMPGA